MGSTSTNVRWRSIATTLAMAMLLALLVAPPGAFAHPGEHNESAAEGEGIGVEVLSPDGLTGFFPSFQWSGTPAVADETAEFAYAGSGCSPRNYAGDFRGKIALVDDAAKKNDPSDPCPIATFFQKVQSAEKAGAIGFVQVPVAEGRSNATAIVADIPALEFKVRTAEAEAILTAVKDGQPVTAMLTDRTEPTPSMGFTPCEGGTAGPFACDGVDLLSLTAADTFNSAGISDLWGWTDPDSGDEYVIMGKTNGVAFFRITDPTAPEYLGELDNPGLIQAVWHDIKVFKNHAFIVSESENHGMTVFDLTRLRDAEPAPEGADATEWDADASYRLTSAAHNLEINEEIGMAYILGGNAGIVAPDQCLSGLHMVDINEPTNPIFRGCYVEEGGPGTAARVAGSPVTELSPAAYVHDAQCVVYRGPDEDHQKKHICVTAAENKIVTVDVTNPAAPITLGTSEYTHVAYAHQGWFDESQTYWFVNDELAQMTFPNEAPNTRTIVMDLTDLDNPKQGFDYLPPNPVSDGGMKAITHNNYVVGDRLYQSNYASGLRVADISGVADGQVTEAAWFDTFPSNDGTNFDGTWSNYPFFESGTIAVSGRAEGLFLLKLADEGDELGVDVACGDCPVEIRSGETGQAHIDVTNTGNVEDTYTVTVDGLPEGWTATADPVTVAAGEHGHTDLGITVPRQAQAGTYTFTVTGTSGTDPNVSDTAEVVVDVVKGKPSDAGKPDDGGRPDKGGQAATAAAPTVVAATAAGASTAPAGDAAVPAALLLALAVGLVTSSVIRRRSTD